MNGVDIGNIHDITIAGDSAQVDIKFAVKADVARHIREDAAINIKALGLLGDKFLEIMPGSAGRPPLPPGSIITGRSGPWRASNAVQGPIRLNDHAGFRPAHFTWNR